VLDAAADRAPEDDLKPGRYVVLSVSDTGTGMDARTQERVFEPFFTTKDVGEGTGLGLATLYGIVKQSGGDVRVRSAPGEGSTFDVFLPVAAPTGAAVASAAEREPAARGAETVLLVEDEPSVRGLTRSVLRKAGYTVLEAACGAEALALAEGYYGTIDLVLSDVVMPRIGGHSLVEQLPERFRGARVLFMSGYSEEVIRRMGGPGSATPFIGKPFTPDDLLRKVRQTLDTRR
jgi:two-component system, cell cycle sensor histidine kinase and response regulator CckA